MQCSAADRPGTCDQIDGAVAGDWEPGANPVAQRAAPLFAEGIHVSRRGPLTAQERRPVIVEVAETGGDVDGVDLDFTQTSPPEQLRQPRWLTQWKAAPFVELDSSAVQFHGRIPEVS